MTALALSTGAAIVGPWRRPAAVGVALSALALAQPFVAVAAAVAGLVVATWLRVAPRRSPAQPGEVAETARLASLAVTAGLPLRSALALAAEHSAAAVGNAIRAHLRTPFQAGPPGEPGEYPGEVAALLRMVSRSQARGSPIGETLAAFAVDLERREIHRMRARVKRLPVKLMLPLALLILPGFVILTIGPNLLDALDRLSGPL